MVFKKLSSSYEISEEAEAAVFEDRETVISKGFSVVCSAKTPNGK